MNDTIKMLICDDNYDICKMLSKYISNISNCTVCSIANNGNDALDKIYTLNPDIVLLDVMMPEIDGLGVLSKLKEKPPVKVPKIIMTTARGEDQFTREAFNRGANYYIIKPFKIDTLKYAIAFVLNNDILTIEDQEEVQLMTCELIRKSVIECGIQTNVLGYQYILEAANIMVIESCTGNLVKNIYNKIATKNFTTAQCVESAIRNAITQASDRKTEYYKELFLNQDLKNNKRPSNSIFLTKLVEDIKSKIYKTKKKYYNIAI